MALVCRRELSAGEELTYDYGFTSDGEEEVDQSPDPSDMEASIDLSSGTQDSFVGRGNGTATTRLRFKRLFKKVRGIYGLEVDDELAFGTVDDNIRIRSQTVRGRACTEDISRCNSV